MRSVVLFIGCSFCLGLAVYLAVQVIWGGEATANSPEIIEISFPLLRQDVKAGDVIRMSDISWVTQKSTRNIPGMFERSPLEAGREKVFGVLKDYYEGEPLLKEHVIWPDDPDFITQILQGGRQAVAVQLTSDDSLNSNFGIGTFVDIYLTDLSNPLKNFEEEFYLPLKLATSLRVVGHVKNAHAKPNIIIEGTDTQIKTVLRGMTAGVLTAVLTAQKRREAGDEITSRAIQILQTQIIDDDTRRIPASTPEIVIQRGGKRDVVLFSSKSKGLSQ